LYGTFVSGKPSCPLAAEVRCVRKRTNIREVMKQRAEARAARPRASHPEFMAARSALHKKKRAQTWQNRMYIFVCSPQSRSNVENLLNRRGLINGTIGSIEISDQTIIPRHAFCPDDIVTIDTHLSTFPYPQLIRSFFSILLFRQFTHIVSPCVSSQV
jgi:hypothetical protein